MMLATAENNGLKKFVDLASFPPFYDIYLLFDSVALTLCKEGKGYSLC